MPFSNSLIKSFYAHELNQIAFRERLFTCDNCTLKLTLNQLNSITELFNIKLKQHKI